MTDQEILQLIQDRRLNVSAPQRHNLWTISERLPEELQDKYTYWEFRSWYGKTFAETIQQVIDGKPGTPTMA